MFIDYKKLSEATRKDHFPLPFIDEMLEDSYPLLLLGWLLCISSDSNSSY
jgi:hypothetical protein